MLTLFTLCNPSVNMTPVRNVNIKILSVLGKNAAHKTQIISEQLRNY
jgi:hypothetical protein